jgi:hypothetical protein
MGNWLSRLLPAARSFASRSLTGKPFLARRIAGAITSASFIVPNFWSATAIPATVPGTPTEMYPVVEASGMRLPFG